MTEPNLSETEVAEWLRVHPDFLARHPDLISRLAIPHETGTTSLIERQVELLRSDNERLQHHLEHLSGVAGENERLMQRLHRLALGLVATDNCDTLFQRLADGLNSDFCADAVRLMLDAEQAARFSESEISALPEKQPDWLQKLLASGQPQCGRLTREKRETVFGKTGAELGSAALIPLGDNGLLAIGATSDDRFHPDMGTLFLDLLRETLQFRLGLDDRHETRRRQRA